MLFICSDVTSPRAKLSHLPFDYFINHYMLICDKIKFISFAASSTCNSGKIAQDSKSTFSILQSPRQAQGSSTSESFGVEMTRAISTVISLIWGRKIFITFLTVLFEKRSTSTSKIAALAFPVTGSIDLFALDHVAGCRGPQTKCSAGFGLIIRIASGPSTMCGITLHRAFRYSSSPKRNL